MKNVLNPKSETTRFHNNWSYSLSGLGFIKPEYTLKPKRNGHQNKWNSAFSLSGHVSRSSAPNWWHGIPCGMAHGSRESKLYFIYKDCFVFFWNHMWDTKIFFKNPNLYRLTDNHADQHLLDVKLIRKTTWHEKRLESLLKKLERLMESLMNKVSLAANLSVRLSPTVRLLFFF